MLWGGENRMTFKQMIATDFSALRVDMQTMFKLANCLSVGEFNPCLSIVCQLVQKRMMTKRSIISSDDWREQCPILSECVHGEPTTLDVKKRLMQIPKMLSMFGVLAQIWHAF